MFLDNFYLDRKSNLSVMLSSILRPRPCLSPLHKTVFNFVTYVCPIQNIKNWKEKKKNNKKQNETTTKKKTTNTTRIIFTCKEKNLKKPF